MTPVELLGVGALVIGILAFAFLAARLGTRALTSGSKRAAPVRFLPWWYIGGQPDAPIPPPDGDHDDEPRAAPSPREDGTRADDRTPVASGRERGPH